MTRRPHVVPRGHALPPTLLSAMNKAFSEGRALVTSLDGHIAIVLPERNDDPEAASDALARVVRALEGMGDSE